MQDRNSPYTFTSYNNNTRSTHISERSDSGSRSSSSAFSPPQGTRLSSSQASPYTSVEYFNERYREAKKFHDDGLAQGLSHRSSFPSIVTTTEDSDAEKVEEKLEMGVNDDERTRVESKQPSSTALDRLVQVSTYRAALSLPLTPLPHQLAQEDICVSATHSAWPPPAPLSSISTSSQHFGPASSSGFASTSRLSPSLYPFHASFTTSPLRPRLSPLSASFYPPNSQRQQQAPPQSQGLGLNIDTLSASRFRETHDTVHSPLSPNLYSLLNHVDSPVLYHTF